MRASSGVTDVCPLTERADFKVRGILMGRLNIKGLGDGGGRGESG